jgi:hypothetical protein
MKTAVRLALRGFPMLLLLPLTLAAAPQSNRSKNHPDEKQTAGAAVSTAKRSDSAFADGVQLESRDGPRGPEHSSAAWHICAAL